MDATEQVLVIPTALFQRLGYFQGFTADVDQYLGELLSPAHTSYRPRGEVEVDPSFKQLIPYVIFQHRDERGRPTVFQYTRGTGQGEGRLHKKRSVGIGGHISTLDVDDGQGGSPYEVGMRRELEEEVFIRTAYVPHCVGLINDDLTEVGRVHLGVVYRFDVERPAIEPRESDILESGFQPVEAILAELPAFETWSQLCMRSLYGREI
jgi:predicted NUDIX family phosphoesterase